jgi:signal transduction histidine kinase
VFDLGCIKGYALIRGSFSTQKIGLLLRVLVVLIMTIGLMVIVRLLEADYRQAAADVLFLTVTIFGYLKLKKDHSAYKMIARVIFFSALVASLFLLRNHPDTPVRFIWFSTIIYMIYYLFDRKEAVYWIGVVGVILLTLFFSDMQSFALSVPDFFVWVLNMLIILMISHWYAQIEEESTQRFLQTQKNLAQEVHKKTQELEERTRELEALNEQLEERVAEEVRKNRSQEQMLFMQARYAQMGEVLSMIAHQWRQPLNAVSSSITTMQIMLRSEACDKDTLLAKAKRMEGYVQHLSGTIDDFRNFFREDKEKCDLTLSGIVKDALNLMYPLLKEEQISVEVVKECNCVILSYPNEILHVVLNILSNARDELVASGVDEKYIRINMYDDEKFAYLEIEDWGGGIDEAIMDKVFDPYFTTKGDYGTGLGLYMSKLIIERHCRGRLRVENGEKGALFRLSFPIISPGNL